MILVGLKTMSPTQEKQDNPEPPVAEPLELPEWRSAFILPLPEGQSETEGTRLASSPAAFQDLSSTSNWLTLSRSLLAREPGKCHLQSPSPFDMKQRTGMKQE